MSDFPTADNIIATHKDLAEALARVWHSRRTVIADVKSEFYECFPRYHPS